MLGSLLVGLSAKSFRSCAYQSRIQEVTFYGMSYLSKLNGKDISPQKPCLVAKLFPPPVELFCTLLEPPICRVI